MIINKNLDFGLGLDRVSLFVVNEDIEVSENHRVFCRNLYVTDQQAPGGVRLVMRSEKYMTDGRGLPKRLTEVRQNEYGAALE